MEPYTNAILWPANLNEAGPGMPREEADVEENLKFLRKMGAVYWDSAAKRKELKGPFDGYIYTTVSGDVEWKCKVEWVISRDKLKKMKDEHQFIPLFRKQCFDGYFSDGREHYPSSTWIKISKIEKLRTPREIGHFEKLDGSPVKKLRGGFVYIRPL